MKNIILQRKEFIRILQLVRKKLSKKALTKK